MMALTTFEFCVLNSDFEIVFSIDATANSIAPTGTAQATTIASDPAQNVCRVATDTAVYVSFGTAPDASSDAGRFFLPANTSELFRIPEGSKGSVVTI